MMKPRSSRVINEQAVQGRNKPESLNNGSVIQRNQAQLMTNQQTSAQAIRKRRSSINVYDQPSSLNSRLRQLETDMLRLDEDRSKLFDDTHSTLAQHELRLNEVHAILKSRHDSVENYVEDMKSLLAAKEDFEKQAKMLNEKHDRMHEKFTHRETTISREIKLIKNKFELLEKSRQFRSLLNKSNNNSLNLSSENNDDLLSASDSNELNRKKSEAPSEADSFQVDKNRPAPGQKNNGPRNVKIKLPAVRSISKLLEPLLRMRRSANKIRRKSNRVASLTSQNPSIELTGEPNTTEAANNEQSATEMVKRKKKGGFISRLFRS